MGSATGGIAARLNLSLLPILKRKPRAKPEMAFGNMILRSAQSKLRLIGVRSSFVRRLFLAYSVKLWWELALTPETIVRAA